MFLPTTAPWLDALCEELFSFPSGRHDDRVDALCIALQETTKKKFAFAAVQYADGTYTSFSSGGSSIIEPMGEPYIDGPPAA